MVPRWAKGSAVIVVRERPAAVRVGQAVAVRPPEPYPQVTVVHEVVGVQRHAGGVALRTKGLANPVADPWRVVVRGAVWHEVVAVPWVGYVVDAMHLWLLRVVALLAVVGAVAGPWALGRLRRRSGHPVAVSTS
jgi:hypothetical protein